MTKRTQTHHHRITEHAALYRRQDSAFAEWTAGYCVIAHDDLTQVRAYEMADLLQQRGRVEDKGEVSRCQAAAAQVLGSYAAEWLSTEELAAIHGEGDPYLLMREPG